MADGSQIVNLLTHHLTSVTSLAFHPNLPLAKSPLLVTGSGDNTAKLWQTGRYEPGSGVVPLPDGSANCLATLEGHSGPILSVAFQQGRGVVATGSMDKTARLWNFNPWTSGPPRVEVMAILEGHSNVVTSVAINPNVSLLVTGSSDNTAKLWSWKDQSNTGRWPGGECVQTMEGHSDAVMSVAFHPKMPYLATGSWDNTVKLWRFRPSWPYKPIPRSKNTLMATLTGHHAGVSSVVFHPTLPLLATGSWDNTVKLWRYPEPPRDYTESRNLGALFYPKVDFSVTPPTCVATLEGHRAGVTSVAFHQRMPLLATGSADRTVKLWSFSPDGSLSSCVATSQQQYRVNAVAFHPVDPLLAFCCGHHSTNDSTVKLWRFSPDDLIPPSVVEAHKAYRDACEFPIWAALTKSQRECFMDTDDRTRNISRKFLIVFKPTEGNNIRNLAVETLLEAFFKRPDGTWGFFEGSDPCSRSIPDDTLENRQAAWDVLFKSLGDKTNGVLVDAAFDYKILNDPVILSDGTTYGRDMLRLWFSTQSTSPTTRTQVTQAERDNLVPNTRLKRFIDTFNLSALPAGQEMFGMSGGRKLIQRKRKSSHRRRSRSKARVSRRKRANRK
jgi:WD40 repeat protein